MKSPDIHRLTAALLPNVLIASVALVALLLQSLNADLYYLMIQEDEYIEWTTFWAFISAAGIYLRKVLRSAESWTVNWCLISLAGFCTFVALEEISWGQRVFGYRPPEYFLAFNFQQEFNLHNIADKTLRKLAFNLVVFGYGVALPLLALIPSAAILMQRVHLIVSPVYLLPAFSATGILMITYPFKFTGEWAELMLGLCFVFAALDSMRDFARPAASPRWRPLSALALSAALIGSLAFASTAATRMQRDELPLNLINTTQELEALRIDFKRFGRRHRCGVHKRLYTYVDQYLAPQLLAGKFAQLTQQGLPEQRAAFLLDPWNTAYWVRDNCATSAYARTTYLYSFGPNRRRDSTKWEVGGDDVAIFVREPR